MMAEELWTLYLDSSSSASDGDELPADDRYVSEVDMELHVREGADRMNNGHSQDELPADDRYVSEVDMELHVREGADRMHNGHSQDKLPADDRYVSEVDMELHVREGADRMNNGHSQDELPADDRYVSEVDMELHVREGADRMNNGHSQDKLPADDRYVSEVDMELHVREGADRMNNGHSQDKLPADDRYVSEVDMELHVREGADRMNNGHSQAPRGRKRHRVCFTDRDTDSNSSHYSDVTPYRRGSNKKQNAASLELSAILRMKCCKNYCLHKISRKEASNARSAFQDKSMTDQRQWIIKYLLEHHNTNEGEVNFLFTVGATQLCQRGWRNTLGITRTRLWKIQSDVTEGVVTYLPSNHHRRGLRSLAVMTSMVWLSEFTDKFGEKLPANNKIHLPSCLTRANVYMSMKEEVEGHGGSVCSQPHFFRRWRKEMPHVTIPKVNRFSKCDMCTTLKSRLEKTTDKEERRALLEERETHLILQMTERRKYYKHVNKAKKYPDRYISLIIDGMDQNSTSVPRFYRQSKSTSSAWKLQSHITGSIVHGRGQHLYVDLKDYPHDSNLTATILINILTRYPGNVPDTLYLQMDNCGRENKNQTILALCALLVEMDIFKKVKIGFLMKGHTHEDVDQLFSRVSTHTSRQNIPTLSSLLHHIPQAYQKPNTTSEKLETVYNIRDWLKPSLNKISQHSYPHQFRITKQNGKAVLHTKKWSNSSEWQATTGQVNMISHHPPGHPSVVPKCHEEIQIKNLRRDMPKYAPYLNNEEKQEWETLLDSMEEDRTDHFHAWPLVDILMAKDSQAVQQRHQAPALDFSNDEQDPIQPVHLGPKQRRTLQPVLKLGDMVGVYLEEYREEWPQVGQVLEMSGDYVTIHWYSGSTTTTWSSLTTSVQGQRSQPYVGEVSLQNVITVPFALTKGNKLPMEIQRNLKDKYEEYYAQ